MAKPVLNDRTRLFINRSAINRCPTYGNFDYLATATLGNLSQAKANSQSYKIQSPNNYGDYDTIFYDTGNIEAGSSSLSVHFSDEELSILRELFESGCLYDLQIHIGQCGIPKNQDSYIKAIMLYGVNFSSHDIENPYADAQSNRTIITESSNITYEVEQEVIRPELHLLSEGIFENGAVLGAGFYLEPHCSNMCGVSNGLFLTQLRYDAECEQNFYWVVYNDECLGNNITNVNIWESYQDLYNPLAPQVKIGNTLRLSDDSNYHAGVVWPEHFDNAPDNFPELINRVHTSEPLATNDLIYKRTDNAMVGPNGYLSILTNEWKTVSLSLTDDIYDVDYLNETFVIVGENGVIRLVEEDATVTNIPFIYEGAVATEDIHKVAYLDEGTYVIATTVGNVYKTINHGKRWKRLRQNLFVENWAWFDKYIGYIAAIDHVGNLNFYQTINGFFSINKLGESYNRSHQVIDIRISPQNPNYFVVSGRISLLSLTNDELILPTTNNAHLTDKGFVIIGK